MYAIQQAFSINTDTATLAIFDPAALAHRKSDTADWWSIEADAAAEQAQGNVIFMDLLADGNLCKTCNQWSVGGSPTSC